MNDGSDNRMNDRLGRVRRAFARIGRSLRRAAPFAAGVLAAFAALLAYRFVFPPAAPLTTGQVQQVINQTMASATPPPAFSSRVYAAIQPSIVVIESQSASEDGLGTGVIVDDSGDILTALHVVDGASQIRISFADGTQANGKVTATQPQNDIAVVAADNLPAKVVPAVLGNPAALHEGDDAFVVGNPFGLYSSMSAGVISGFGRAFSPPNGKPEIKGLIQIDAAVNPGNSGGPLLNRDGQVVGIVTGIVNPTDQNVFIGIGFAVPIDVAGGAIGAPQY
jgi:S1-C subfamily serine protease